MKKLLFIFVAFFFLYNNGYGQQACLERTSAHIRLVGDSWLHFPAIYQAYDSALAKYGFADYFTVSDGSVLIGMTAETLWQNPLARFALEAAIQSDEARPIDIVMVSLGGNDVGFPFDAKDSLSVIDDDLIVLTPLVDSIFDFVHTKIPQAQIIWQCYDFPNFSDPCIDYVWNPYCDSWNDNSNFTPFQANRFLYYFTAYQDSVVREYQKPYSHFFNLNGLMQWRYGQTSPLRYPPYGTYAPRSVPFPGGNVYYPSPQIAMGLLGNDAYHLGPQGYTYLAEFYMRKFISNYLRRDRDTSIFSMGQNFDGWADANNVTGTGDVLVGKRNSTVETKGVFSFNTSFIPSNKIVKKASVFFKVKTLKRTYPLGVTFPQNFTLDIKTGAFGNNEIEAADFAAVPTSTDIACFAGRLIGDGYALRADIHPDALKYINKNGITQFKLSISDDNLINFYNGDTTAFEGPYLDIYYDTTTITTSVINKQNVTQPLQIFPNPATNQLTVTLNKDWLNKKSVISIFNTEGKLITSESYEKITNSELKINISQLAAGGYFISIENEERKSVGTFIKLKE